MANKKSKKASTKGTATKAKGPSKTDFILSLPLDMPAAEVATKAQEAGIALTEKYIYKIRSARKAKAKRPATPAPSKKRPEAKKAVVVGRTAVRGVGTSSAETKFVDAALDLGL